MRNNLKQGFVSAILLTKLATILTQFAHNRYSIMINFAWYAKKGRTNIHDWQA